jgi:uncharacterized protein YjbJ (UPF0337 family)
MDENRIAGAARNIGGKVQEGVGRATGDTKTEAEGLANQIRGTAQDLYGQARESTSRLADDAGAAARRTASSFEVAVRNTVENQPYTAVVVALALGWLLGRTHRPL